MSKIRINELARELEVKPKVIVDLLPEFGVQEKKTHSSSIDEDVALAVRKRLTGNGAHGYNGDGAHSAADSDYDGSVAVETEPESESERIEEARPIESRSAVSAPEAPEAERTEPAAAVTPGAPAPPSTPASIPLRAQAPAPPAAAPPLPGAAAAPPLPETAAERPAAPGASAPPAEESRSRPIAPIRPPLSAGAAMPLHPPVRNVAIPARPVPPAPKPGQILSGPRQPLPPSASPAAPPRPPAPAPQVPQAAATPGTPAPRPAAPAPPRPAPSAPRPAGPRMPLAGPGAPQQGASQGSQSMPLRAQPSRPNLAGQPPTRPVVPPSPEMMNRLQQMRQMPAQPPPPRPGMPKQPSGAAPGQPIYRGPIRPGQPVLRGPGLPGQGPGARGRTGRPMHPTTPLRAEPATPPPADTRRQHAKPAARQARVREEQEGKLWQPTRRNEPAAPPPIDREITVAEGITVKELSEKLGVKANLVIKKLVEKKVFATINQTLDTKLAEDLARDFGASTNKVSYEEETTQDLELAAEPKDLQKRPPVVTIMGHVDHGKTSLLDSIRLSNVAEREAGGITQHIGAYHVEKNGRKIVFIDTPGHEAFTRMRARGAKVTDIVILVVAADDGVMPQTLEAIDHAKAAGVPIIVAINKIDKPDAQPERIKQQLADRGLLAEDWGGDTVMVPVSAKTKQNQDLLLEMILLVADLQDLKASPERPAVGSVLEAKLDRGRGPVATVLVRNGTLRVGDFFICGSVFGKVRAMFDDRGQPIRDAEPSLPVEVLGLDSLPEVGDTFQVVTDTAKAKQIVMYREGKAREQSMNKGMRVTLEQLHEHLKEGEVKELNIVLKTDVGGTAEVLTDMMQKLSNDKVKIRVLHSGVGAITETDVLLASASNAIVIGFNVRPERNASSLAEQEKVDIRLHTIIYELTDELKRAMTGMLEPVFKEVYQGRASVRETFKISKVGTVAGCMVLDGLIRRDSAVRLLRDNVVTYTGKIETLKRFKNDASEVKSGFECGITLHNFNDVKVGDVIEAYTTERVAAEALA